MENFHSTIRIWKGARYQVHGYAMTGSDSDSILALRSSVSDGY